MKFERNYKLLSSTYWEFFIPTLFTVLAGNGALIIDSIIVSTLIGVTSLSGIQVIQPLSSFFSLLCWMIGLGGSLLYTAAKSDFNEENANKIYTVAVTSITSVGLIIAVLGVLFTGDIINLVSTSAEANSYAIEYFRMYVMSVPFSCYMLCTYYFVRGEGMTRLTLKSTILVSVINLTLDIVFMKFFNMGIAGSGLATAVSFCVGAIFVSVMFFKSSSSIRFIKLKLASFLRTFIDIIKSGFAGASSQLYLTICMVVYNSLLISFSGHEGLYSLNICINTLVFMSIFVIALMQSASPILAVYYKEKDYSGINYIKNKSLKVMGVVGTAFAILLVAFPQVLIELYSVSSQSAPFVMNAIQLFGLRYLTMGFLVFYIFYAQSIQKGKLANIISILYDLVIKILVVYALAFMMGINGIWLSFICTDIIMIVLLFIYSRYLHKKTDGEYEGLYINKVPKDNVHEFTINANVNDAKELSSLVKSILKDNPSADYVSQSLEEFLIDTIERNDKMDTIDVFLNIEETSVNISIKDSGIERSEEFSFKNEDSNYTRKLNHSRVLGLNSTLITIN